MITKRYNDFHSLNADLRGDKQFRGIKFPNFPGKAISFTHASKKELAEERMQQLQQYLNGLICRTIFLGAHALRSFLIMPVPVRDLTVILVTRQSSALKQGYMFKKGEYNTNWRKRWFVLLPNFILKYYKDESAPVPRGTIDISTILKVQMKNTMIDRQFSFALKSRNRIWHLACATEVEKREWAKMFMRLKDIKAPPHLSDDTLHSSAASTNGNHQNERLSPLKSLNLVPHFKRVNQIRWCPTIPGILATGSEDESVKIWQTHLLDHTSLLPNSIAFHNNNNNNGNDTKCTIPLHTIEFQPIAEFKTSGPVTSLEWSPDGSMLVVSLMKVLSEMPLKYAYFIQCFDLHPILGSYSNFDDDFNVNGSGSSAENKQRSKIFTLQDHPSRLVFNSDGSVIYMAMDIDPNSEENEKRRPAFLVYLDLEQNQLHRCKTVDRIIDHQTEFIVDLAVNHGRNLMIVGTCTHQGKGRMIAWDMERNTTKIIERQGSRISSMIFTDDDKWLIVGRVLGTIEYWMFGEQQQNEMNANDEENDEQTTDVNDTNTDGDHDEQPSQYLMFEMKFSDNSTHTGPVFNMSTSNGILLTSAKPQNLAIFESFFVDSVVWDIRHLMNNAQPARMICHLHNINENDKDITRLLDLCPVTARHVREGAGPGTLLAASGDRAVYCHNLIDVLLDAIQKL